jgi:hypothetical protein
MTIDNGKLMQWSDADQADAETLKQQIDTDLTSLQGHEVELETGYVRLANALIRVREKRFWVLWEYQSWTSYLEAMEPRIKRGRAWIFRAIGTVGALREQFNAEEMTTMGINKAMELKKFTDQKPGERVPDDIRRAALDPKSTVPYLQQTIFESLNTKPENAGTWYQPFEGFYATEDEREMIQRGISIAKRVDPVIPNDLPRWAQDKAIIERLCMEFISTYSDEVEGKV